MIQEYLKQAAGPMPWYWTELPKFNNNKWVYNKEIGVVMLQDNNTEKCRLVINTYTRVFKISNQYIGIWYEEKKYFEIVIFDVSILEMLDNKKIREQISYNGEPYICENKPKNIIKINKDLSYDYIDIKIPQGLKLIPEIFLIGRNNKSKYPYSIYVMDTVYNRVHEFPQKWFTEEKFDIGYSWITKATRHPITKRIIGSGIRISDFILLEDGCWLDRWT